MDVYRNLHRGAYSIRDRETGRVIVASRQRLPKPGTTYRHRPSKCDAPPNAKRTLTWKRNG